MIMDSESGQDINSYVAPPFVCTPSVLGVLKTHIGRIWCWTVGGMQ